MQVLKSFLKFYQDPISQQEVPFMTQKVCMKSMQQGEEELLFEELLKLLKAIKGRLRLLLLKFHIKLIKQNWLKLSQNLYVIKNSLVLGTFEMNLIKTA